MILIRFLIRSLIIIFLIDTCYADIIVDTSGNTTGGAVTSSPMSDSNSTTTIGDLITGPSTATIGDTITGASTATTGDSSATSGDTTITSNYAAPKIPVSTAYSPANHPTAPCMGSSSAGASAVSVGFSMGTTWESTECMIFEAARSFDQAGMHEDALAIKCTSNFTQEAPSCIKLAKEKEKIVKDRKIQYMQIGG